MAEDIPTINLKILSPSTEVEGGVNFTDLPSTTTIKELRSRIQDAVPSRPVPERMRLIYRGRVVANEADTLGNVFGADNIRESKDQSLHLVLRELPPSSAAPNSPASRSSTAPPNPFRAAQPPVPASPPLQTNPFRTLPRPNSQPQVPPAHPHNHHHHHPHMRNHVVQGPFQIPLLPAFQQQMAQAMMAQNGQLNPGQAPAAQDQPPQEGAPVPENGAPVPPMGLPPLPSLAPRALPLNNGQTVRQEGIGPNGERWSVTYSSTMLATPGQGPNLPRPFQPQPAFGLPPPFGLPPRPTASPAPTEALDRLLPRMRSILQTARQEMDNITTLLQTSGEQASTNPPLWRFERIRQHVQIMGQNLGLVEQGLNVIAADASMTDLSDAAALRTEAHRLRERLEEFNNILDQQGNAHRNVSQTPAQTQTASQTLPPGTPEELFILSSPQGPVGLLFDQRGTYMTAPFVPTLPFQTFTNQFAQNRQLIAGMGHQIAHGSSNLHNQLANIQPTPTQQPFPTGQPQTPNQPQAQGRDFQPHGQVQVQAQPEAQNANPPAANPQADVPGMGNIGHHLWTLFKIACFVYFFSGGGGWYKSLMLGLVAGGVYLAQLGLFEEHFAVIREFFEGILPAGAFPERLAAPRNANPQPQPGRTPTPEEAARRLLQQHEHERRSWIRESIRTVERGVSLFVASLWPGIGERMVHAQEERERLERVAETERREAEEERVRREAEAAEKKDETTVEGAGEVSSSSAKGKERADVVEEGVGGGEAGEGTSS